MPKTIYWMVTISMVYMVWIYVLKPNPNLSQMPEQSRISRDIQQIGQYTITDLEGFSGEFRILGREEYNFGREAEFSPVDFVLGWGKMADPSVYDKLSIRQSNRWYYWHYENEPPISRREIETSSSNVHIIPADELIAKQLKKVRKGDMVYLTGALVEIKSNDGWVWRSSLSREDTGSGACELFRVDAIRFL